MTEPYTPHCRCGATWTGSLMCHCSACHVTFTTVGSFDSHRSNDSCLSPGRTRPRLVEVRPGVFGRSGERRREREGASQDVFIEGNMP